MEETIVKEESLDFDQLLAKFQEKMNYIPKDYWGAMGWLYVYRQIQEQRKQLGNRANQMSEGKRVFWGSVMPLEMLEPMYANIRAASDAIEKNETLAARELHKALRKTDWYLDVAVPAAKGIGISENAGTLSAAKIMWAFASGKRFSTFGKLVKYARLAPENGKAPGRARGSKVSYSPAAWQSLYDLSDCWKRMPDCYWRVKWDEWKLYYSDKYPEYPKGRIDSMGRRKVIREFLRDLWDLWCAWEEA